MHDAPDPMLTSSASTASEETKLRRRRAMYVSLGVAVLMLVGKLTATSLTGSSAIFSDALESVIHLFATGFAGFSLWYAATPPDWNHPYGHGKVAYFASAIEGILIGLAALGILLSAGYDLWMGTELQRLDVGLYILVGLTIINLALGQYLIRVGRQTDSLVLVSNGKHVMTDMWTSLGVIVGVGLVWLTDVLWLDPLVAIAVGVNILWTSGMLLRRSVSGLMDRADPVATQEILKVLEDAREEGVITNYHQVRHRRTGDEVWVEYHLMFPGDMSIDEAHARSHTVEDRVDALFPKNPVTVTAHLEPRHHDDAHPDGHAEPHDPLQNQ